MVSREIRYWIQDQISEFRRVMSTGVTILWNSERYFKSENGGVTISPNISVIWLNGKCSMFGHINIVDDNVDKNLKVYEELRMLCGYFKEQFNYSITVSYNVVH